MTQQVILVDKNGNKIGTMEKMDAHKEGKLHKAFSIFILNSEKQMLLQKREISKYHSGGLWSNTCCSHPGPGEDLIGSAQKRLSYEMGINCELKEVFHFKYKVKFEDSGLYENELDYILSGSCDSEPVINRKEVEDYKWVNVKDLLEDINKNPEIYTFWFKAAIEKVIEHLYS